MSARLVFRGVALAAVAWVGVTCAALAQAPTATPLAYPALTGRVVDDAGLLTAEDRAALTASLAGLEVRTTNQVVVVTVKSLQGAMIEDYGYQLGRLWGIGQRDKDSGALLIVAAAEQRVRIEVGYGLEGTLTDAATRLIIENSILPAFKAGDFPGGIKAGVSQIIQVLGGDTGGTPPRRTARGVASAPPNAGTPVWLGVLLGLGGVGLLVFCAVKGGAACRGVMQLLLMLALSGRGGSSRGRSSSSFSGGGGSFGGGGSSGSW